MPLCGFSLEHLQYQLTESEASSNILETFVSVALAMYSDATWLWQSEGMRDHLALGSYKDDSNQLESCTS